MNSLQRWLPGVALVWILFLTYFGLFRVPNLLDVETHLSEQMGAVLTGILLVVGIANVLTIRFLVLPRVIANPDARKEQVIITSYMFAVAPAVYGVVTPLFTGQGLLALPFGAIAVFALVAVWSYLRDAALG